MMEGRFMKIAESVFFLHFLVCMDVLFYFIAEC